MIMMAAEAEPARNARAKVNCAFPFPDLLKRWLFLFILHLEPEHNDDNVDYVDNNDDDDNNVDDDNEDDDDVDDDD